MSHRTLLVCLSILVSFSLSACGGDDTSPSTPTDPSIPGGGSGTGTIVALASGLMNPGGLAVDASFVYWSEAQDGATATTGKTWISKVSKTGGAVIPLSTRLNQNNYVNTWSLAIDASYAYWTESNQDEMALQCVSINGGSYTTLVSQYPKCLAADATSLYFSDIGTAMTYGGVIRKVGKGGGAAVTIATNQGEPNHIAVSGSTVCWISDWDGTLNKTGTNGGGVTLVAQASSEAVLVMDTSSIYYSYRPPGATSGSVMRVSVNGGTPLALTSSANPVALAVDATHVYWTDSDGKISRVPKGGGTVTSISVTSSPMSIALDAGNVYWLDNSSLKKIAKW